jgi:uncharacterized protein (TIGR00251 family)
VVGVHGDEIRVRIAAAPVDGAANDTLIRFLAERLGVGRSAVAIVGGARARSKAVQVSGVTRQQAANRLGII